MNTTKKYKSREMRNWKRQRIRKNSKQQPPKRLNTGYWEAWTPRKQGSSCRSSSVKTAALGSGDGTVGNHACHQPFDLSDVPGTYMAKGENQLHGIVFWPTHTLAHTQIDKCNQSIFTGTPGTIKEKCEPTRFSITAITGNTEKGSSGQVWLKYIEEVMRSWRQ